MRLRDAIEASIGRVKFMKENSVAEHTVREGADTDLLPIIEGWRGEAPVVTLMPHVVDRESTLGAAKLAAVGYGCDLIVVTSEGWHPTAEHHDINPITGQPWGPGQMQDVAEHHQGLERGIIAEALTVVAVNKAGDVVGTVLDYKIVPGEANLTVEWAPDPFFADNTEEDAKTRFEGYMADRLVEFMEQPNLLTEITKRGVTGADFGLDDVETMAHADCAMTKVLSQQGFAGSVGLLSNNPERTAIIERSLNQQPPTPFWPTREGR